MEEPKAASSKIRLTEVPEQTIFEKILAFLAIISIIIFPLILLLCFRVINQYKRAIIMRFGKLRDNTPAGPGVIFIIPYTDYVFIIDLRTQLLNLPAQEIITRDSVTVTVDALVYFHVLHPFKSSMNVQSYSISTKMISVALLRNVLGQHTLAELLTSRDTISQFTRREIDKFTSAWGVELERLEIKEILLPVNLQKAMAAEAEGTRIAKAKIIEAKGEIRTAENLRDASRVIGDNPQIMLLRYLQTLNQIAAQQKTSILFPFPVEFPESMTQFHQDS